MSKEIGFPVMSTTLTGYLFVLGIFIASLGILLTALGVAPVIVYLLLFIGLFLFGWALLSYGLHPDIDENRRAIAFFFAVLIVTILYGYGVQIVLTI